MEKIIFSQLTPSEIRQILREEIHSYFSENPVNVEASNQHTNVVDLDGLLKARPILGSKSTIYKKAAKGQIPTSKRGKKLFFSLEIIDDWLLANKVITVEEIRDETINYLTKKGGKS